MLQLACALMSNTYADKVLQTLAEVYGVTLSYLLLERTPFSQCHYLHSTWNIGFFLIIEFFLNKL